MSASTDALGWFEFKIYSTTGDDYHGACKGRIRAETTDLKDRKFIPAGHTHDYHTEVRRSCLKAVDSDQFYQDLLDMGYEYGPFFRLLK